MKPVVRYPAVTCALRLPFRYNPRNLEETHMMNRRQFFCMASSAAVFVRIPSVFGTQATKYDLLVKSGRLVDPSRKLNAIRDVAIANGKIAAVATSISGDARETIDA